MKQYLGSCTGDLTYQYLFCFRYSGVASPSDRRTVVLADTVLMGPMMECWCSSICKQLFHDGKCDGKHPIHILILCNVHLIPGVYE